MGGDRVGEDTSDRDEKRTWMLSRRGDFSRNGDEEVGGNLPKRKGGLIMRVGASDGKVSG